MKKLLRWAFTLALATALLYFAGGLGLLYLTGRDLEFELTSMKNSGTSLSLKELTPAAIPESENAAPVYDLAVRKIEVDDLKKLQDFVEKAPKGAADIETLVTKNRAGLDEMVAAAGRRKYVFPKPSVEFESRLLKSAALLQARCLLSSWQGKKPEALRDLRALLHLSASLRSDPNLSSIVWGGVVSKLAVQVWGKLKSLTLTPADWQSLTPFLDASELDEKVQRGLARELANGVLWITDAGGQGPIEKPLPARTVWVPMRNLDALTYVRKFKAAMSEIQKPYKDSSKPLADLHANLPPYAPYTAMILPGFDGLAKAVALEKARLQMLRLAIDMTITGDRPAQLKEINPLTGEPWKAAINGARFTLDGGHPDLKLDLP